MLADSRIQELQSDIQQHRTIFLLDLASQLSNVHSLRGASERLFGTDDNSKQRVGAMTKHLKSEVANRTSTINQSFVVVREFWDQYGDIEIVVAE